MNIVLTVPLRLGTLLANVQYAWTIAGVQGGFLTSGITQPAASFAIFRISVAVPVGAEGLLVSDATDPTNYNVGDFEISVVTAGIVGAAMILEVPLRAGATLANIVYSWIAGGVQGGVLNAGISQPSAAFPMYRISVTPPANAEELIVYDSTDLTNWNVAGYKFALVMSVSPPTPVPPLPPAPVPTPVQRQIILIVKSEFIPIVSDNQALPISNLGALRYGLDALTSEDAKDLTRANELWAMAKALLAAESSDDDGAGSSGIANVEDDFDLAGVGRLDRYYW
jgi:hypothetical protein